MMRDDVPGDPRGKTGRANTFFEKARQRRVGRIVDER